MTLGHDWPLPMPDDWRLQAACRDLDPDLFHPLRGASKQAAAAKAVCATCPVTAECLAFAVSAAITDGIYGGKSPRERRGMIGRSRPRPINHGTEGGARTHQRRGERPCAECREAAARAERERRAA